MIHDILIVCTGNSCRSPMAEGILKNLLRDRPHIKVHSAGTNTYDGMLPTDHAVLAMHEIGIDIKSHQATQLTADLIESADIILVMASYHKDYVLRHGHNRIKTGTKTYLLEHFNTDKRPVKDVEDPVGQSLGMYRRCRDKIKGLLENFIQII